MTHVMASRAADPANPYYSRLKLAAHPTTVPTKDYDTLIPWYLSKQVPAVNCYFLAPTFFIAHITGCLGMYTMM
jgi:hypothetical protein